MDSVLDWLVALAAIVMFGITAIGLLYMAALFIGWMIRWVPKNQNKAVMYAGAMTAIAIGFSELLGAGLYYSIVSAVILGSALIFFVEEVL